MFLDMFCTEAGSKHRTCSLCGDVQHKSIHPLGHDSMEWMTAKEPTCTEGDTEERRCTRCGEVLESRMIKSPGHSYGDWTTGKEPNYTEDVEKHHTCSVCGHKKTETLAKLEKKDNKSGVVIGIVGGVLGGCLVGIAVPLLKKKKKK